MARIAKMAELQKNRHFRHDGENNENGEKTFAIFTMITIDIAACDIRISGYSVPSVPIKPLNVQPKGILQNTR
jgi:hypothetical protein